MHYPGWQRLTVKEDERSTLTIPWEWTTSPHAVAKVQNVKKNKRRETIDAVGWNIYSTCKGEVEDCIITKENQSNAIGGIVLDYDAALNLPYLKTQLDSLDARLRPQFIEISLSGNLRLFWQFRAWVPTMDNRHAGAIMERFGKLVKADKLHPGFDRASYNPCQRWTNGYDWMQGPGPEVLPDDTVSSLLHDAAKQYESNRSSTINLDVVKAEIDRRWPGRWEGEFKDGARGVRFWDDSADNTHGVYVKAEGVVCVTGDKAWVPWEEIFGADWVQKHREEVIGDAVNNIYYDGHKYWRLQAGIWRDYDRQDTLLHLQNQGFSNRTGRGETVSAAGRILNQIQEQRRVDFAAPLVCRGSGIVNHEGSLILNTNRLKAMPPADEGTWEQLIFIRPFLENLFVNGVQSLPFFLAWLARSYKAFYSGKVKLGQSVFICGPKNNGKTFLTTCIVKPLLGGRAADPQQYFTGETPFNSELFEVFLWQTDDAESPKEKARGGVQARIKSSVVNRTHMYHKKFGAKMMLPWTGRYISTLNDDAASVGQLPHVGPNTQDKLMFFRTQDYKGHWPGEDDLDNYLAHDLPIFARMLLNYEPPPGVAINNRIGVRSFFDPHVLRLSSQQQSSYNFHELVQSWLKATDRSEYAGSVTDILGDMLETPNVSQLAREYKVYFAHKALTELSREAESGVSQINGDRRIFKIEVVAA